MAHKNENQLIHLIKRMNIDFSIYVHLDLKSQIDPERIAKFKNTFVFKNYRSTWGSYGTIEVEYLLMKEAYYDKCDYFILLSGQDYPIKSNKAIANFCEANSRCVFLEKSLMPVSTINGNGGLDRVMYYWEDADIKGIIQISKSVANRIVRKLGRSQRAKDYQFHFGSNWFNLPRLAVYGILIYIDNHPEYMIRFKQTRMADEIWLQTLIHMTWKGDLKKTNLRYIDWEKGPEHPRILREDDIIMALESDALFARKFDEYEYPIPYHVLDKI